MQKKPKALVLAFKNLYLNSTDDVFYEALGKVFDLVFYGPGYTPLQDLVTDSLEIYEKFGPFDACFVHQYVMHNLHSFPKFLEIDSVNQCFPFDKKYFCDNLSNFGQRYNKIPCQKFLISLRTDCYAFTPKEEEEYAIFDGYLIIPPPEVLAPISEQQDVLKEEFKFESTDRYIKFCKNNEHRIIPVAHLISSKEFTHVPLGKKKYLVSVPGCPYIERQNAFRNLSQAGYKPVQQIFLTKLARYIMHKTNVRFGASASGVNFFKWTFKYLIAHSRVTFTDGSRVKAPIRKYFEIPAFSSLLAAEKFYNVQSIGFIGGTNFVECDSKTIIDVVKYSLKNPEWTEKIIKNSRELVKEKHSTLAWEKHMKDIYSKILSSEFRGAKWLNGILKY